LLILSATEYHLGLLKAKLAKYRAQLLEPSGKTSAKVSGTDTETRNTLDCDQSNYSSRIVFSHSKIPVESGPTQNSAI